MKKSPAYYEERPAYYKKRPAYYEKRPAYYEERPAYCEKNKTNESHLLVTRYTAKWDGSLLQNIVSFTGLFCKRDL